MATKDCDSCGEATHTPPVCAECAEPEDPRAARLEEIRVRHGEGRLHRRDDTTYLLAEVDRLRSELSDLSGRYDDARAERDRLQQALGDEEAKTAHYRDQADRLAGQVQRVRDLCTDGRFMVVPVSVVAEALDGPAQ